MIKLSVLNKHKFNKYKLQLVFLNLASNIKKKYR